MGQQYVITIVPVYGDGTTGPAAQTVVKVDTSSGQPVVREVRMLAADGSGLTVGALPHIDFGLLVRAFTGARGGSEPARAPQPLADNGDRRRVPGGEPSRPKAARRAASANRGGAAKKARLGTGRAYRRAPSLADLEAAYTETGTITGVATRFDVPVHTAQGWITRMRRQLSAADES